MEFTLSTQLCFRHDDSEEVKTSAKFIVEKTLRELLPKWQEAFLQKVRNNPQFGAAAINLFFDEVKDS